MTTTACVEIVKNAYRASAILQELEGITIPDQLINDNIRDGRYDENSGYKNISYKKMFQKYVPLVGIPDSEFGKILLNVSNLYQNITSIYQKSDINYNIQLLDDFENCLNNIYQKSLIDQTSYQNCQNEVSQLKHLTSMMLSGKNIYDSWFWFHLESLISSVTIAIELNV